MKISLNVTLQTLLIYFAIQFFPSVPWMPWVFALSFAFFAYLTYPGPKAHHTEILFWYFGVPFSTSAAAVLSLIQNGAPADPIMVSLFLVLAAIYILANKMVLIAYLAPLVVTDPTIRRAVCKKPIAFFLLLSVAIVTMLTHVEIFTLS